MADAFIAGLAYGCTSVMVGQPLDTLKTRAQMQPGKTNLGTYKMASDLLKTEGMFGFYRGSLPMLIGGSLFRSAQFGVNNAALEYIRSVTGGPITKKERIFFGVIDYQVVFGGFCGGIARGIVESPFEFVKVRRQVDSNNWSFRDIYKGSGATIARNSFLFSSFVVYMDISKLIVDLPPFALGSINASLAWLTIWPMDVVKSKIQSGAHEGKSIAALAKEVLASGAMTRGIVPGIMRSAVANGCAMVVMKKVEVLLAMRKQKQQ